MTLPLVACKPRDNSPLRRAAAGAGQALVELALVCPLFILILVGAVELGRIAYVKTELVNAARAAVAYGAQNHTTAANSAGMQTAAQDESPEISAVMTFSPAPTYFCACSNTITASGAATKTSCSTTCSSGDHLVLFVQANTQATINTLFNYPGIASTFTLNGQAIMRVEQ
jgi:Flp pilus assembly protein TadG